MRGAGKNNFSSMLPRLIVLGLLVISCSVFYYFGEIVDFFKWDALHFEIFYTVHDMHRLLFLIPIFYAAYFFGLKATIILTLLSGGIWIPRGLFISPYSFPLLRSMLSIVFEGGAGLLMAYTLQQYKHLKRSENETRAERNSLSNILNGMKEGVMVTGPDYKVRFTNEAMSTQFGHADGLTCYKYLYHFIEPCAEGCPLRDVINGKISHRKYDLPDGTTYEVIASPYKDMDSIECQLSVFRNTTGLKQ